jgi:hypothetical protein
MDKKLVIVRSIECVPVSSIHTLFLRPIFTSTHLFLGSSMGTLLKKKTPFLNSTSIPRLLGSFCVCSPSQHPRIRNTYNTNWRCKAGWDTGYSGWVFSLFSSVPPPRLMSELLFKSWGGVTVSPFGTPATCGAQVRVVKKTIEWELAGETGLGENLRKCHSFHHNPT